MGVLWRSRWGRGSIIVLLLAGLTAVGSALGAHGRPRDWRSHGLEGLYADGGAGLRVAVGDDGKPILGPDRKPLRVARNGAVVTSTGKPLLDRLGRAVRVTADHKLPASLLAGHRQGRRHRKGPVSTTRVLPVHHVGAPGSTATTARAPIVVGVQYPDATTLNSLAASLAANFHLEDPAPQARAVADYVNATGGIDGHPVSLRLHKVDVTDGQSFDAEGRQSCDFFSTPPRPAAVLNGWSYGADCFESRGIPIYDDNPKGQSTAFLGRHANTFFVPASVAVDRVPAPYVHALQGEGFFNGGRVGLLRFTGGSMDDAGEALHRTLDSAGIKLAAEDSYPYPTSPSEQVANQLISRMAATVVAFRAAGVDHVISLDHGEGLLLASFLRAADQVGYHPRLGLSSLNAPAALQVNAPARDLAGAVGMGWSPFSDTDEAHQGPLSATGQQCHTAFTRAGVPLGDRSYFGQHTAYRICDEMLVLRDALHAAHASGAPTTAAVRSGMESLGDIGPLSIDMGTQLDASHHDGATGYRELHFDGGCSCFLYDGAVQSLR